MEEFPGCVSVNIPTDRETGRPRGYVTPQAFQPQTDNWIFHRFAFLEYQDELAAQEALQNDKMELDGRTLSVNYAKPRGMGGGGGRGGGRRGKDEH